MAEDKEHLLIALLGVALFGLISALTLLMMANFEVPSGATDQNWWGQINIRQSDWLNVK